MTEEVLMMESQSSPALEAPQRTLERPSTPTKLKVKLGSAWGSVKKRAASAFGMAERPVPSRAQVELMTPDDLQGPVKPVTSHT